MQWLEFILSIWTKCALCTSTYEYERCVCVCVVSFFFILLLLVSIHLFFCLLIHRIFASAGGISDSFPLKPFSLLFLSPQLRIIDFCSNCVWWNLLLFFCCCSPWMCSPSYQTSIIRMKIIFLLNNNPRITMDNKTTETEYTNTHKTTKSIKLPTK